MSRAIILHGKYDEDEYWDPDLPTGANSHWYPWIKKRLLLAGYDAQAPEVFRQFEPDWKRWQDEFERHVVDEPMTLIGHSCGGGFLVRWLSEHPNTTVDKLLLVAPWIDPQRKSTTDFFEFSIDQSLINRVGEMHIFYSTDDQDSIQETVAILTENYPTTIVHKYTDMGHFVQDEMKTNAFPDLLNAILG